MANKEFKSIEEFIEGFTRNGPTPEDYNYDGVIWGMEFQYKNRIFRVTRDTIGHEKEIRIKFNKSDFVFDCRKTCKFQLNRCRKTCKFQLNKCRKICIFQLFNSPKTC